MPVPGAEEIWQKIAKAVGEGFYILQVMPGPAKSGK
jgi:hypothetical protein